MSLTLRSFRHRKQLFLKIGSQNRKQEENFYKNILYVIKVNFYIVDSVTIESPREEKVIIGVIYV